VIDMRVKGSELDPMNHGQALGKGSITVVLAFQRQTSAPWMMVWFGLRETEGPACLSHLL